MTMNRLQITDENIITSCLNVISSESVVNNNTKSQYGTKDEKIICKKNRE